MISLRSRPSFLPFEAITLACVSIFLCWGRLTGALAYEFSLLLGTVAFFISIFGTVIRQSTLRKQRPVLWKDLFRIGAIQIGALVVPLVLVLINSYRIRTCRYDVGIVWFLLLPFVSTIFGTASGIWGASRTQSPWKGALWSLVPFLLFSLLTIRDIVIDPALSFFHPAIGFYSGPIYDEWIPITGALIGYRIWTLALSAALIGARSFSNASAKVGILLVGLLLFREPLGWHQGLDSVRKGLGGYLLGANVRLFYDKNAPDLRPSADELALLDRVADRIASGLLLPLSDRKPIDIYLFSSPLQKHRFTGIRHTAIGNPLQRAVFLPAGVDLSSSLVTHEVVHALSGPIGLPIFKISALPGLLEGLATAFEEKHRELTPHEGSAALLRLQRLPDLRSALGYRGFYAEAATRSYLASGSFCRWLIERYGMERFKKVYAWGNFRRSYGRSLDSLVGEWEGFLSAVPVSDSVMQRVEAIAKAKSIFERTCPHDVADEEAHAEQCRERKNQACIFSAYERAWDYSSRHPSSGLKLLQEAWRQNRWDNVASIASELLQRSGPEIDWVNLYLGDAAVVRNNPREALIAYHKIEGPRVPEELVLARDARTDLIRVSRIDLLSELVLTKGDASWVRKVLIRSDLPSSVVRYAERKERARSR